MKTHRLMLSLWLTFAVAIEFSSAVAEDVLAWPEDNETAVLYDSVGYQIDGGGGASWREVRRTYIADKAGAKKAVLHLAESQYVKIKKFKGRIYSSPNGKPEEIKQDDLVKQCGFGASYALYTDDCIYYKHFEDQRFPILVEYDVTSEIDKNFSVSWPGFAAQRDIPIRRAVYTVAASKQFDFNAYATGTIPPPDTLVTENTKLWKWVVTDVDAFETEPYMPPASLYRNSITFVPESFRMGDFSFNALSWTSLSAGYARMIRGQYRMTPEQAYLASRLSALYGATPEFVTELHDSLSNRCRYIAVEVGIGGWMPHSAAETYDKRYGDCKDLATMYASMMEKAGIDVHPALIETRDEGRAKPDFPSLLEFNHFILFYLTGTDTVWVDPTCFDCAQGDLPWVDENTYALAVDTLSGNLVMTAASRAEDNAVVRRCRVFPNSGSTGRIEVDLSCVGNVAHALLHFEHELDNEEMFEKLRDFELVGAKLTFVPKEKNEISTARSRFDYSFSATDRQLSLALPNKIYMDFSFLPVDRAAELTSLDDRSYPIDLLYPRSYYDTCVVVLPSGYVPAKSQLSRSWSCPFGDISFEIAGQDSTVVLTRSKTSNRYQIDPSEFAQFAEFIDSCKAILEAPLILVPRNDANLDAAPTEK